MTDADVLVVGNGMVGHGFVEALTQGAPAAAGRRVLVVGEERLPAYDRVHLSSVFEGVTEDELALGSREGSPPDGVELVLGDRVAEIDATGRVAVTDAGRRIAFETCVLATGSYPWVPPIPGVDARGVFVYRTLDDLAAIGAWAAQSRRAAVVGGGLLGLEAANALRLLGLDTTVVELAPRLMAVQLDEGGASTLARHVKGLGLAVRTGVSTTSVRVDVDGRATGL
ncbi:MAG: FAD-dependent oxidoreductase, partial [Acidimicrobiaceae bacterium]|nr:FAD-dependent oxidoreductase [Acidimicrobiaceae bacterium]